MGKHKDKCVTLWTYNKTSISKLGVCSITIMHKNSQKLYRFSGLPGNEPDLLSMLGIEELNMLAIGCDITKLKGQIREISDQMVEKECFTNKTSNLNPIVNNNNNC